jgi:hypothetical protein
MRTQVGQLYVAMFGRAPDSLGLSYWTQQIAGGKTFAQVAQDMFNVDPARTYYPLSATFGENIARFYNFVLGRPADQGGLDYWTAQLTAGKTYGEVFTNIITAVTLYAGTDTAALASQSLFNNKVTVGLYYAFDLNGTNIPYATTVLGSVTSAVSSVQAAKDAAANFVAVTFTATTAADTFTGTAGNDVFNADHTTFGATDSLNGGTGIDTFNYVDSGTLGGALAAASVSGIEIVNIRNVNGTAAVAATVETANAVFTAVLATKTITLGGLTYTAHATTETTTAAQIAAGFAAGVAGPVGSGTITGTLSGWTVTSSGSNSVKFTATTAGNVTDLVDTGNGGGSTTTITQGVAAVPSVGITDTIDANNFVGATAFNSNLSTQAETFTNLAAGQSIGMIGNGSVTNGALTATYGSTVTAPVLNLTGGTTAGAVAVTAAGATSFTINSTGASNTIGTLAAPGSATSTMTVNAATSLTTGAITTAVKQITVAGAATSVTLGATTDTNLVTIDASGLTAGGVTTTLLTGLTSFKGGQGADSITTATLTATTAGQIDGGAGTDTLIVAAAADVNSTVKGAEFVNFEVLRTGAFSLDASLISGITALQVGGAGSAFTNMTATQAGAITARSSATGGTFTLTNATGTADVLGLTLKNSTTATPVNFTTATIDGFETLNVAVNGGIATAMTAAVRTANGYDNIGFTSASTLKAITATGAFDVDINLLNAVKVTSVDVSAMTGGGTTIELAANTGALVVTGSAAADIVTLATAGTGGTQTVNTGAGNDTIIGTQAQVAAAILNGGAGSDTLNIIDTGAVTIGDNTFVNATAVEKLTLGATTGLTFVVGGYANAIATGNGGVLDVTVALDATGSHTASSVDASGLGAGNSLKLSFTDAGTGTATTDTITLSTGADAITVVMPTGSVDNLVITGGTAALASTAVKTIDMSGIVASGTVSVTTGAGNDVIKAGATVATITAGSGADTITLIAADGKAQTIVENVANQSTTTAFDVVNNFAGNTASGTADQLQFASNAVLSGTVLGTGWTITNGIAVKTGATVADFTSAFSTSVSAGAVAFSDGTNTWVGYSDGTAGLTTSDQLVELVGVVGFTAVATTFSTTTISIV